MSEERPWENTAEVPQRFQAVAAGNENAGPYLPSKTHVHGHDSENGHLDTDKSGRATRYGAAPQHSSQEFAEPSPLTQQNALPTKEEILEALKDVIDPELGINIVDLGLIYGVELQEDGTVVLEMTLTSAACPLTDVLEEQTQWVLSAMASRVQINWVWMPPWGPDRISEDGREQLRALGFNV